ncbi:DUF5719 family protein [Microbacterium sp. X-17]|uniref:DUF5719 family protein n=1 Tax=Microbacterium sp. X-17 TaxID=3144404 RepID=UPI0031F58327
MSAQNTPESPKRGRRWAATSARVVVGLAVGAGLVIVGIGAIAAPWPQLTRAAVTVTATPAPDASVVTCAGPLLAIGRTATQAGGLSFAAPQSVLSGVAPVSPSASSTTVTAPGVSGSAGALTFTAPPGSAGRTDLAASGSSSVEAPDLRGLAVSGCRGPLSETWLVGGATTTGSADLVVLSNPGAVPATVQLTVYGGKGGQTAPGGTVVVAPGTQRVVPLAGLLLGEPAPVVRVTATGAPVQATIQTSLTRVLTPGGVEQVGPAPGLAPTVVIPGVVVPTSVPMAAGNTTTVLRMLAPSSAANAKITVTPVGGADVPGDTIPLAAGVPAQVDLSGLTPGTYTIRVDADQPIVGAAWQATGLGQGSDFAWFAAAPAVSGQTVLPVPAGPAPVLAAWNPTDAVQTISLQPASGTPVSLSVPAHGSASAPVVAGTVYTMTASGPVQSAVSFSGAGALSSLTVWPAQAAAATVVVAP